jgi:hypothetical protein
MTHEVMSKCFEYGEREFNPTETVNLLNMYGFRYKSWRPTDYRNLNNKVLTFKVRGHHHKGYVVITLGWNDTYTVRLMSTHGTEKFKMEGVYFDMLFDVLDERIERIPEYTH